MDIHARAATWLVLVALITVGCGPRDGGESGGEGPLEVPVPDLSEVEEDVREHLLDARKNLDRTLASSAPAATLASAYGQTGMLYHGYQIYDAAEACYRNARRLAPDEGRWRYYLGHLYRTQDRLEEARAELEAALALRPEDLPTVVHLARLHLDRDAPDEAEPLFRLALEQEPDLAAAVIGLAKIAAVRGENEQAVEYFEAALRLEPGATEIHYPLGLAYRRLGREEEAAEQIAMRGGRAASFRDPLLEELGANLAGWRVHYQKGTTYFREGMYREALAELRTAAQQAPDEASIHTNLGSTLSQLGDSQGALREFEEAVRLAPTDALAQFNLGSTLARAGRDEAAVRHFEAAIELNPELLGARRNLGNALRRLGRFEEALPHYTTVVEGTPSDASARLAEVLTLARLQRYREARDRAETAHEAIPEDRRIRWALIVLLSSSPEAGVRNGPLAMELGRRLVAEESSLPHVAALAMAAAETGEFEQALTLQRSAVQAAEKAGPRYLPALRDNLARYERGEPCREPWRDDDPVVSPLPLSPAS